MPPHRVTDVTGQVDRLSSTEPRPPQIPSRPVPARQWRLRVDDHDGMRAVTYISLAGIVFAFILARIGGLPFDIPMPTHRFGWVEPTCGLTRGATAIARGHYMTAWRYNPAAFLVMIFGVAGVLRAIVGHATGRWLNLRVRIGRFDWVVAAIALIGLEMYQQQHAAFIINSHVT